MTQSRAAAAVGDGFAIGLSGLCLIHCLALPLAAGLLPLAGAWAQAEWVHWLFATVAAPVTAWVLIRPRGRSPPLVVLALAGLGLLFAGAAGFPSHELETPMTAAGGLILAAAHLLNWRRRGARCIEAHG